MVTRRGFLSGMFVGLIGLTASEILSGCGGGGAGPTPAVGLTPTRITPLDLRGQPVRTEISSVTVQATRLDSVLNNSRALGPTLSDSNIVHSINGRSGDYVFAINGVKPSTSVQQTIIQPGDEIRWILLG